MASPIEIKGIIEKINELMDERAWDELDDFMVSRSSQSPDFDVTITILRATFTKRGMLSSWWSLLMKAKREAPAYGRSAALEGLD